jgi:predicted nucleic acid-binding protein
MRYYADTSFLVKLLTEEEGTPAAVADYRRLGRPSFFFLPLHGLEVANAIRQRAFHLRRAKPTSPRAAIDRERDAALAMIRNFISQGAFVESSVDMDAALDVARDLSEKHTERLGCRGFDLLHVAVALKLECEAFLTTDRIQAAVARAEGLAVTVSAPE